MDFEFLGLDREVEFMSLAHQSKSWRKCHNQMQQHRLITDFIQVWLNVCCSCPRPIVHSTNQSDDFVDDDSDGKTIITVITRHFAVLGVIGLTMQY